MTIDDMISNEKLQYDIKISYLLGRIDKFEYLISEEILPSNQRKTI